MARIPQPPPGFNYIPKTTKHVYAIVQLAGRSDLEFIRGVQHVLDDLTKQERIRTEKRIEEWLDQREKAGDAPAPSA